jgi:hypothetical protein
MRRFVVVAALAIGLATLWAAIQPLVAQPVPGMASPAISGALFLCRSQRGIDRTCAEALARALIIQPAKRDATSATDRACHPDRPDLRRIDAGG